MENLTEIQTLAQMKTEKTIFEVSIFLQTLLLYYHIYNHLRKHKKGKPNLLREKYNLYCVAQR